MGRKGLKEAEAWDKQQISHLKVTLLLGLKQRGLPMIPAQVSWPLLTGCCVLCLGKFLFQSSVC